MIVVLRAVHFRNVIAIPPARPEILDFPHVVKIVWAELRFELLLRVSALRRPHPTSELQATGLSTAIVVVDRGGCQPVHITRPLLELLEHAARPRLELLLVEIHAA